MKTATTGLRGGVKDNESSLEVKMKPNTRDAILGWVAIGLILGVGMIIGTWLW